MITGGVDPGLGGAVALVDFDTRTLLVHDMPTYSIKVGAGDRRRIDLPRLHDICNQLQLLGCDMVALEDVWGFPGQGVTAAFWLGHAAGCAQSAITAARLPLVMVQPKLWKKTAGIPSDKDSSRRKASELWPEYAQLFARQRDDGRAEAVLLADFAAQHLKRTR